MNESQTLAAIRLALGREPGLTLFRNNVGCLQDARGQTVRFGLHPGSSDLIGFRSVVVTPEMIGRHVALFTALEVKAPGGRHPVTAEQRHFLDAVTRAGGLAGAARSPDQARLVLGLHPTETA